jgi:hypothetical protein
MRASLGEARDMSSHNVGGFNPRNAERRDIEPTMEATIQSQSPRSRII